MVALTPVVAHIVITNPKIRKGECGDGRKERIAAMAGGETEEVKAAVTATIAVAGVTAGLHAVHLASGAEIAIAPDLVLPTASVFKTPLVVEVFHQAEAGLFSLDDRIELEDRYKTLASGVLQRLQSGIAPTIRDLIVLTTIISDNTATEMLVERIGGAAAFNRALANFGMADSHYAFGAHGMFLAGFGLPPDAPLAEVQAAAIARPWDYMSAAFARDASNTVSTARDIATLIARIAKGEILSRAGALELMTIMAHQQHTDRIPRCLPYGSVSNKTGTIGGVRSDAGLIRRGDDDLIAYAMLTFDPTPLPAGNSAVLRERAATVNALFADIGVLLWDRLGRAA